MIDQQNLIKDIKKIYRILYVVMLYSKKEFLLYFFMFSCVVSGIKIRRKH